jgi:hypothetical protein
MIQLILKRASASRPSGEWNDDDFDVLADSEVVGRIFHAAASPVGSPTHGYEAHARGRGTERRSDPVEFSSSFFRPLNELVDRNFS